MKPFIGIGITTYRDISSPAHGVAVYEAYQAATPSFAPDIVRIDSSKYSVGDAAAFADLWRSEGSWEVQENRGRGPVIDKGTFAIGAEWKRTGRGGGKVRFRSERRNEDPDTILIEHPYAARTDWLALFRRLVTICEPAYAMMHLFTEDETRSNTNFVGPFAGEELFVGWRSSDGARHRPDRWQTKERHTYRFLPALSWANFLGPEFDGQFDPHALERDAAKIWREANGCLFTATENIADVADRREKFSASRDALKAAFAEDCFFRQSSS